ncbi:MAG TPA: hypothetical protein VN808_09175 [Stellaceae bacterium]|nr:hypothetical protein [Stellaceae bacterium]
MPIVLGTDDAGLPVKLHVGETRVREDVWTAWLAANLHSRLIADGKVRRVEKWQT